MPKPIISKVVVTTSDGGSFVASIFPEPIPKSVVVNSDGQSFVVELPYPLAKSVAVTSDGSSFETFVPQYINAEVTPPAPTPPVIRSTTRLLDVNKVIVVTADGSSYECTIAKPASKAVIVDAAGASFEASVTAKPATKAVAIADNQSYLLTDPAVPTPPASRTVIFSTEIVLNGDLPSVSKVTQILLNGSFPTITKTTQILLNGSLPTITKTTQILLKGSLPTVTNTTEILLSGDADFTKAHDFVWTIDRTPITKSFVFAYRLMQGNTEITMPTYFGYSIISGRVAYPLRTVGIFQYALPELVKVTCSTSFAYDDLTVIDKATAFSYQDMAITSKAMVFNTSNPTVITKSVALGFSNMNVVTKTTELAYTDTLVINKATDFSYAGFTLTVGETSFNYQLRDTLVKDAAFAYELSDKNWVTKETRIGYKLLADLSSQSIQASPTLYKGDTQLDFIYIDMSSDETSPFWLAEVGLSASATFADLNINDDIEIRFPDTTYKMVVDGKALSRRDNAEAGYVVKLVSPLARLDIPFADTTTVIYTVPKAASEVVAEVLGQDIAWNLPDWMIGVEQLQWVDESPLSIARKIVEAIGGVIESMPDGSINCRKKYPTSPQNYLTADHTHLSDAEVFDISETVSATATFNRLDVYNSPIANSGINDSLEYKALDNNPDAGIIHGYPSPYRPVDLVHTGDPATTIIDLNDEIRTEVEMVEFIGGKAQTRYPIDSISSITWNVVNLGSVTYSGKNLTSAVAGESLLNIVYRVRAKRFDVSGADQTIVQFCLVE